jgi:hypothetical protein
VVLPEGRGCSERCCAGTGSLGDDVAVAARVLDCDHSKIGRLETGQRGALCRDLRDLLAGYGVEEEAASTGG